MKIRLLLCGVLLGVFMSCNESNPIEEELPKDNNETSLFAKDDGSQALPTNSLAKFNTLLKAIDPQKVSTD